jgi:hypothetical protein
MEVSGYQFKSFLKFLDITQDEASKRLNVSRQTINTWCKLAVLDDSALQNVKSVFSQFENWVSDNYNSASIVSEPSNDYKSSDPLSQLIRNNTILVESNAMMADSVKKLTDQIIKLCSNEPPSGLTETIEAIKREITETIRGELKNNHAREDAKCADVG